MSRQTKVPPIFSLCLVIARSSDANILLTNLGAASPLHQIYPEFPRDKYSEVLEETIVASLDERPTEKLLLDTTLQNLRSLAATPVYKPDLSAIKYLGCYESPNWGASIHYLKYYVLVIVGKDDIIAPSDMDWKSPVEVLAEYNNIQDFKFRLSPPTLGTLRGLIGDLHEIEQSVMIGSGSHTYRFWHALAQETTKDKFGVLTHLEFAPGLECIPIASNTLFPFHATNLVSFVDGDVLLITDPGANDIGKDHLLDVLERFNPTILVIFLTHHHHDHVHSLNAVAEVFPKAILVGHPYTLKKIATKLERREVCENDTDEILEMKLFSETCRRTITAISLPGHTRGHLALWEPISKTLVSGDHTVGYGSSVLDPNGGGNMVSYLESTQRLLKLDIQVILPCHGAPTLQKTKNLLQSYIEHRISREEEIKKCWLNGTTNLDVMVKIIYSKAPERVHPIAKRNILLHLEKLHEEKIIELNEDVLLQIAEYHRKRDEFVYH